MCWKCHATKGSENLDFCYTNVASDAGWLSTEYCTLPWSVTPELSKLPGFSLRMLALDTLHIFHLGIGRDLVGSILRVLCTLRFWVGNNLDQRLASASVQLKQSARAHRLQLRLRKLTKANLNWRSSEYPESHTKGFDTYIILKWLNGYLIGEQQGLCSIPDEIATLIWSSNQLLTMLSSASMFLTEPCPI